MSTLSKIRFRNGTPYILPPKIYKGDELVYDLTNDVIDIDFSTQYFTIESLEDNNWINFNGSGGPTIILYWSTDNGATWDTSVSNGWTLNSGEKIIMKCTCNSFSNSRYFSSTKRFNVSGNIMSLLYGDDFIGQVSLPNSVETFYNLFKECTKLVSAENLVMPATTLSNSCYGWMFKGCTSLTKAPKLPATSLTQYCYTNMFYGCTSLVNAPALPATTLAIVCYKEMFYGCTSLIAAPKLPAATLVNQCYYQMFNGCTSLTSVICLATDISAYNCLAYWLGNTNDSGTFYKAASMNDWPISVSGIHSGWTVVDYVE